MILLYLLLNKKRKSNKTENFKKYNEQFIQMPLPLSLILTLF